MRPTISQIENAFQPSRESSSAERFAGRRAQVEQGYLALLTEGSSVAIVGNRGIGKSSLARQIMAIAEGDNDLLDKLGLAADTELDFLTVYIACSDATGSVSDLLARLLSDPKGLGGWLYDIPGAKRTVEALSPELRANIFGVTAGLGGEKREEVERSTVTVSHPVDAVFQNVCNAIAEEGVAGSGLLIAIDEFDQVKDPTGLAGLVKAMATNAPQVKFCIVGVAADIQNLMREHQSADRLFAGSVVSLPPMSDAELEEIIDIAESAIGGAITFDRAARDRLVQIAHGHPYMVHLVGKFSLRRAHREGSATVGADDVSQALHAIAEVGADPVLEGRYKTAVGSSPQREAVLKALAQVRRADGECWTTDAYPVADSNGVDNPSQYVGHLVIDEYGGELTKVRERYYRFKDSLFAAYALARPSLFEAL